MTKLLVDSPNTATVPNDTSRLALLHIHCHQDLKLSCERSWLDERVAVSLILHVPTFTNHRELTFRSY